MMYQNTEIPYKPLNFFEDSVLSRVIDFATKVLCNPFFYFSSSAKFATQHVDAIFLQLSIRVQVNRT